MTGARNVTQLCCSPNLVVIVANKIEQSFYSVYSYSRREPIEHARSACKRNRKHSENQNENPIILILIKIILLLIIIIIIIIMIIRVIIIIKS